MCDPKAILLTFTLIVSYVLDLLINLSKLRLEILDLWLFFLVYGQHFKQLNDSLHFKLYSHLIVAINVIPKHNIFAWFQDLRVSLEELLSISYLGLHLNFENGL